MPQALPQLLSEAEWTGKSAYPTGQDKSYPTGMEPNTEIWVTIQVVARLLNCTERNLQRHINRYKHRKEQGNGGCNGNTHFEIALSSLPGVDQRKYFEEELTAGRVVTIDPSSPKSVTENSRLLRQRGALPRNDNVTTLRNTEYNHASLSDREFADSKIYTLSACTGLEGRALVDHLQEWNFAHPDHAMSYRSVLRYRRLFADYGMDGLLPQWGGSGKRAIIKPEWMDVFKRIYLTEGAVSVATAHWHTREFALRQATGNGQVAAPPASATGLENFPSGRTFHRALNLSESSIYLARHGNNKHYKKYAPYLQRDYSQVGAGTIWVGDHHQLDVAMMLDDGKVVFPWLTAWIDYKTSRWLGWSLHAESPNSDHIFESFYLAAQRFGIPEHIYIDNGKDYRCHDFAGGRITEYKSPYKIDESRATSLMQGLGIEVHYAIPYNAQSKIIEPAFRWIKEWFSKLQAGYRGGNVTERPEKLLTEIDHGNISTLEELDSSLSTFMETEFFTRYHRDGQTSEALWNSENVALEQVTPEALRLFCARSSKPLTVGRNGVKVSDIGFYFTEALVPHKGEKVYIRRIPNDLSVADVYSYPDEIFICQAELVPTVPAMVDHDNPITSGQLRNAMETKNRVRKLEREAARLRESSAPSTQEIIAAEREILQATGTYGRGTGNREQGTGTIRVTKMDTTLATIAEQRQRGTADISGIVAEETKKKKLKLWQDE